MGQTKKRRRKHRGTQAGTIDRRGRRSRPRNRAEARAQVKTVRAARGERPPTWRGALVRGLIAAGIFAALLLTVFGQKPSQALPLAGFMLVIYIPMGYYTDYFFYRRRARPRPPAEPS